MKHPRYSLVIPVVVLLLLCSITAWAAGTPANNAAAAELQKHFNKGLELQKAGKLDQAITEFKIVKKMIPGRIEPIINLAIIYARKNDLANAEAAFKQVLAIDPKNQLAIEQLPRVLVGRKKDAEALKYARKLVDMKPKDYQARFLFGVINLRLRNYESALDAFKTTSHMKSNDKASLYNLSYCYMGMKRYSDALETLDRFIKLVPDETQAVIMASFAAEQMGDKTTAIKYLESAADKGPSFAIPALENLIRLYDAQGSKDKSTGAMKRLVKIDKSNLRANFRLAKAAFDKGDYKEAEARYLAAKSADKTNPEINTNLAIVQTRLNKLDAAQASISAALKADSKNTQTLEVSAYINELRGNADGAIAAYRQWEKYHPTDATPNARIGNLRIFQRDNDEAYKEFEKALKKDPKSLEALTLYAKALSNNREYAKAYDYYVRAMNLKPGVVDTMLAAAYSLEMQKKYDESIALLKKTAEDDAKSELPYLAMGRVYDTQKKQDMALDAYKKALEVAPKSVIAGRSLAAAYNTQGKYEDEIAIRRKLMDMSPATKQNDAVAITHIYAEKLDKLDTAIEECRKLVDAEPECIAYRVAMAEYLIKKNDNDGAIAQYTEIAKQNDPGTQTYAYEEIANIQQKAGKTDDAIASYKKALGFRADSSKALTNLAAIYESQKKTDEFCAYLKTLVEPAKPDLPYRFFLDTFKKAGKTSEALKTLAEAEKKSPDNEQIITVLAAAYEAADQKDAAITEYKKILSKNDGDPRVNKSLGYLYMKSGRDVDALQCFNIAAKTFVNDRQLLMDIGALYEKLGKKSEALAAYKNYLKWDPANQEIRKKVFSMENPGITGGNTAAPASTEAKPAPK